MNYLHTTLSNAYYTLHSNHVCHSVYVKYQNTYKKGGKCEHITKTKISHINACLPYIMPLEFLITSLIKKNISVKIY